MSAQKHISPRKVKIIADLVEDLKNHNTIGMVQMESIGARTVQKLRSELRDRARIVVAKNTLMRKALKDSGISGWEELLKFVSGPSAFLFTNDSPYQIANYLDKNKVKAPAKAGQISPINVTVPKLNTGFPPGIIISELNSVGLPTRIEGGTVAVPEDTQVLSQGEKISTTLASILTRLGIEPFLVGLSLDVVLENGEIIEHSNLIVDFDAYRSQLVQAFQSATNVAIKAGYITDDTIRILLGKAQMDAFAVAAEAGYLTEETAPVVLGKATANALALMRAVLAINPSAIPADIAELATPAATPAPSPSSSPAEESAEEKEEEEEEGEIIEDDDDEGLGGLFG